MHLDFTQFSSKPQCCSFAEKLLLARQLVKKKKVPNALSFNLCNYPFKTATMETHG